MIKGIGIDIVELKRIKKAHERNSRFVMRILTKEELMTFEKLEGNRQIEFLAGRFAAKEAYAKAYGTGIGKELSFQDIQIEKDEHGKPFIRHNTTTAHVSISHSQEYAVANVILES